MEINLDGISVEKYFTGLLFKSKTPLFILANRDDYDFVYSNEFDNHYLNNQNIDVFSLEEDGIYVASSVEIIDGKYFTNVSVILDVKLDTFTITNIFKTCVEAISYVSWTKEAFNDDQLYNDVGNYYNTIFVACRGRLEKTLAFDISLYYQLKELLNDALTKSFDYLK